MEFGIESTRRAGLNSVGSSMEELSMDARLKDKAILVTAGTGCFGEELVEIVSLEQDSEVLRGFSQGGLL